jgi:hypothetical protein
MLSYYSELNRVIDNPYAECLHTECHYAKCQCADCRGANILTPYLIWILQLLQIYSPRMDRKDYPNINLKTKVELIANNICREIDKLSAM